jgi:polyphosphate kinase 2 (PPK2 family)
VVNQNSEKWDCYWKRNRAKLKEYLKAVEEMLERTSTGIAPWTIGRSEEGRAWF